MNNPSSPGLSRREFNGVAASVAVVLTIAGCDKEPTQAADAPAGGPAREDPPKLPPASPRAKRRTSPRPAFTTTSRTRTCGWSATASRWSRSAACARTRVRRRQGRGRLRVCVPVLHKAKFDEDSMPHHRAKAERPLERLKITLVKDAVPVDPTKLFKDKSEWTADGASLTLWRPPGKT